MDLKKYFSFYVIILLMNVTCVHANMMLNRMIVHFKSDKQWEDIIVNNPDKEALYLSVSVTKVKNPGTPREEKITVTDPKEIELLVSPQKVIIPAHGRQTVRIARTKPSSTDKEITYQATFVPVIGKIHANKNAIKILISYQAIIFLQPPNPFIQVASVPDKNTIKFTNMGNVNVLLNSGKYCPHAKGKDKAKCIDLEGIRVYAGESWTMKLPENAEPTGEVIFSLHDGSREHIQTFPLSKRSGGKRFAVL